MNQTVPLGLAVAFVFGVNASPLVAANARVFFIEPTDGAAITNPVTIKFGVEGLALKPAGDMSPDSGHHHMIIDGGPVSEGDVIPANEKSLHFGRGQTETVVTLPPGQHTLTLQFANGAHVSYGPKLSATITINVKQ